MWFFLAFAAVCFTIIVLFRMYIDLRRIENQHNRLMRSDQRDYERYIQASSRELPKASMPDFTKAALDYKATRALETQMLRHRTSSDRGMGSGYVGPIPDQREIEQAVTRYLNDDYDRFIEQQRRKDIW